MIEYLTQENLEEALVFAETSHKYSAWQDYPFDKEILRRNLLKMIGSDLNFTCIYRKGDKIIGYFFARLGRFLFSDLLLGMENGIFIEPEHRGGRVAALMFGEYQAWCQKMKAEPLVEIYFGADNDNEKTYSFFRKVGMIECGRVFRGGNHGMRNNS